MIIQQWPRDCTNDDEGNENDEYSDDESDSEN